MKPQGVVLLHKSPGQGSFSALSPLKKALNTKKIGHTGTLDQFAQGLLIALVGPMTKLNQQLMDLPKTYKGEIFFGKETDTLDPTGSVIRTGTIPSLRQIEQEIPHFLGETEQYPPKYSALKVQGKRASDLIRQGKDVELQKRSIFIDQFEILSFDHQKLEVLITCSKGTYIRSIARDLAYQLGTVAHLSSLVRVAQGPFLLDMAVDPYEFKKENLLSPFEFLTRSANDS